MNPSLGRGRRSQFRLPGLFLAAPNIAHTRLRLGSHASNIEHGRKLADLANPLFLMMDLTQCPQLCRVLPPQAKISPAGPPICERFGEGDSV